MQDTTAPDEVANFAFEPSHMAQLRHIADTDEFFHDEEAAAPTLPSSSSSSAEAAAAGPSERYDWPELKDAIKHQIQVVLEEEFGKEREMELHPAAKVHIQESSAEATESSTTAAAADATTATAEDESEPTAIAETTAQTNGFISATDQQNFYPIKRPLSTHTYPALSPDQIQTSTKTLHQLLDDFDLQPPFTIQRLCELLVNPTEHYKSGSKWIRALERCLSVTTTRDAFPISPVQAPVGVVGVNGTHDGEGNGSAGEMSESEMDRMDGLPPSTISSGGRSRSSSVGSNASTVEPLFSPIPFIVRDENGVLTHAGTGEVQQNGQKEEPEGGLVDQIPDLELGGADRTGRLETEVPREVVDVAPPTSTSATAEAAAASVEDVAMATENVDEEMQEVTEPTPAVAATAAADASTGVAAAVDEASASAPTTAAEPLGVPDGAVDELDNPSQTVNPLTSTTTTSAGDITSEPTTAEQTTAEEKAAEKEVVTAEKKEETEEEEGEEEDAETSRSSKRRKSVASIHDSRE